jgi:hypothetical protein
VRLLQQQRWQDLQLMYDAAGGAQKLNPIQLCALTQTLARLAPPTELLAATERQHLNGFATEVGVVWWRAATPPGQRPGGASSRRVLQ